MLAAGVSDLKVEEAYYWCYAQHLAPGYFDHPPMVAWLIALAGWVAHPMAVRLPAILLFLGSAWLLYATVRRWRDERVASLAVVLHGLLPAFNWYSVIMMPDGPLMFFWTLGMYATTRLVQDEDTRWWWLVGVATGLGMDAKYPALLLPLSAFLALWWLRKPARLAWCGPMWGAAALAVALFGPVIYWNATHDFASFRFQGAERFAEANRPQEKVAGLIYPALMLGPALYLALPWAVGWAWRQRRSSAGAFALAWALPFSLLVIAVSTRRLVNLNWPLPAYLGALLILAPWIAERPRRAWLLLPSALLGWLPLLAMAVPLAFANATDDLSQWQSLRTEAQRLRQSMPRPQQTFFLGHGYQSASQLAFGGLGLDRIVSVNALGMRGLAFDYWTDPAQFVGWDALVINYARVKANGRFQIQNQSDPQRLQRAFERLEPPLELTEYRGGAPLRRYFFVKAYNYRGPF